MIHQVTLSANASTTATVQVPLSARNITRIEIQFDSSQAQGTGQVAVSEGNGGFHFIPYLSGYISNAAMGQRTVITPSYQVLADPPVLQVLFVNGDTSPRFLSLLIEVENRPNSELKSILEYLSKIEAQLTNNPAPSSSIQSLPPVRAR